MQHSCEDVKIFGHGMVKSIKGSACILGHVVIEGQEAVPFYAPTTHCALVIKPWFNHCHLFQCKKSADKMESKLSEIGLDRQLQKQAEDLFNEFDVVLLVSALSQELKSSTFSIYPEIFKLLPCDGFIKHELNTGSHIIETEKYFVEYPTYQTACDEVMDYAESSEKSCDHSPVILTAGGKNTGKSTFNRYLMNKMLQKFPHVYYLECDIGQTEFTPSGMISLNCVSKPLLGPPFSHQVTPIFSVYYGNVTAMGDPDRYLEAIEKVFRTFHSDGIPLVVNTMGWNKALGLHLLVDTIRIIKPTHILQMVSSRPSRNLPCLTKEYISEANGWMSNAEDIIDFGHRLITLDAEIYSADIVIYKPSDLRDMALLSYLEKVLKTCNKLQNTIKTLSCLSISSLCAVRPYVVRMSDVKLCVAHETGIKHTHALGLFNASIVGLCVTSEQEKDHSSLQLAGAPTCECLGLGLVRGVDPCSGTLFLISGLTNDVVKRVNCLVLGVLCLPEVLHQRHSSRVGREDDALPPYISGEFLFQVKGSSKFRIYRNKTKKGA